jgi:hypothetical protein
VSLEKQHEDEKPRDAAFIAKLDIFSQSFTELRELLTSQTSISQSFHDSFTQIESSQSSLAITVDKHYSESVNVMNRRFDLIHEELIKVAI